MARIYLSPPDVGTASASCCSRRSTPTGSRRSGPHVDAFEREFAGCVGVPHAAALSSGTAALHLALVLLGVRPGDNVLVPSLTFVATANAVTYVGARPVFIDSDARHLEHRSRPGRGGARRRSARPGRCPRR